MDFNERLQRIGAEDDEQERARRVVEKLREPASRKIRELLATTADYLTRLHMPLMDIRGMKKESWSYEIKPFLMKPRTIEKSESFPLTVGQGWIVGHVNGQKFWPATFRDAGDPVFLNTKGELVGGHKELECVQHATHVIFRPPPFISTAPRDIVPIYDDLKRRQSGFPSFTFDKHLPSRRAFGVAQDGRPVFINFQPHSDYGSPWSGEWLDDFLASVVSVLIKQHRT